jgi:prepilin-type processing-associated H-X9-DG protein
LAAIWSAKNLAGHDAPPVEVGIPSVYGINFQVHEHRRALENNMSGLASKFMVLFKKTTTRKAPPLRRTALGVERLDQRAVLSTVTPTTVADDVVVDGPIITGGDFDSARSAGQGGGGQGKVSMQDFHFSVLPNAAVGHPGGANVLLGDGSVRFVKDSINISPARTAGDDVSGGDGTLLVYTGLEQARSGAHGSGGGAGKVSMRDFDVGPSEEIDPVEIIVAAGGATGGHVKVFDGTSGGEVASFFAFSPEFQGGVRVAAADVGGDNAGEGSHGTHVAGTIGVAPSAGSGTPSGQVRFFDRSTSVSHNTGALRNISSGGAFNSHADLYQSIWINQTLEDVIDVLARDASRQA